MRSNIDIDCDCVKPAVRCAFVFLALGASISWVGAQGVPLSSVMPKAAADKAAEAIAQRQEQQRELVDGSGKRDSVWSDQIFRRIEVTGSRTLGLHLRRVEGDREAYGQLNYFGQGNRTFTDSGTVRVSGKNVLGVLNFDYTLSDNRFSDPQSKRFSVDYLRGPLQVNAGDIAGSLTGPNRFASFARPLRGIQAAYVTPRFALRALRSDTKGSVRTVELAGNNTGGPYYLQANQIVVGTERVRIDNEPMALGRDYQISYEGGTIVFPSRTIPPTSTIIVSFEELDINTRSGTIQGAAMNYDFGSFGRAGLTYVQQRQPGGGALNSRTELFQGYGSPSTPYFLQFRPLTTRPIVIKVDGILQIEGVDYRFDDANPSIFYFNRFIPSTSTIEVLYVPMPTGTPQGDRTVFGFDYTIPFGNGGRNGAITYMQAHGKLSNDAQPMSGMARGIDFFYTTGPLRLRSRINDIPAAFTGIETTGFNRNEKSTQFEVEMNPHGGLRYGINFNNAAVSTRVVDSVTGEIQLRPGRTTMQRGFLNYSTSRHGAWDLIHQRSETNYLGRNTKMDTSELLTRQSFGRFRTNLGLAHQNATGPVSFVGQPVIQSVSLNTLRYGLEYASRGFAVNARGSTSAIRSTDKSGTGSDYSLSAAYVAGDRLSVRSVYTVSRSGELATLGQFSNGLGLGYVNSGFSNAPMGAAVPLGASDASLLQFSANYALSRRFGLEGRYYSLRSSGGYGSNTQTQALGFALNYDLGQNHLIALAMDNTRTRFIGSDFRSDTTLLTARFAGSPIRSRWNYEFLVSTLVTGGNSLFGQNSATYEANLLYRLAPRQQVIFSAFSSNMRGYLPQQDFGATLAYQYQLYANVALRANYRFRNVKNLSATEMFGAYRANSFDLELVLNFIP